MPVLTSQPRTAKSATSSLSMNVAWADDRPFCMVTASMAASSVCRDDPSSRCPGTGVNGTATCSFG